MGSCGKEFEDVLLLHPQDIKGHGHCVGFPLSYEGNKDPSLGSTDGGFLFFFFKEPLHSFPQRLLQHTLLPMVPEGPYSPFSQLLLVFFYFICLGHSDWGKINLQALLICISLTANNGEHS